MANNSILSVSDDEHHEQLREDRDAGSYFYNSRLCHSCGASIFGMPGGMDAHCPICGYKDPCCSD